MPYRRDRDLKRSLLVVKMTRQIFQFLAPILTQSVMDVVE
jgi:hypothetical protein